MEAFQQTNYDREAFAREIKQIKLSDNIKIWRTNMNAYTIREECKVAMLKSSKKEKVKQEKVEYTKYCCGLLKKKKQKTSR